MVSPLRYFKNDPNKMGRGPGVYYLRGNGYYSQYSIQRDRKKLSKGYQLNKVGSPKGSSILHTSDGNLPR